MQVQIAEGPNSLFLAKVHPIIQILCKGNPVEGALCSETAIYGTTFPDSKSLHIKRYDDSANRPRNLGMAYVARVVGYLTIP